MSAEHKDPSAFAWFCEYYPSTGVVIHTTRFSCVVVTFKIDYANIVGRDLNRYLLNFAVSGRLKAIMFDARLPIKFQFLPLGKKIVSDL